MIKNLVVSGCSFTAGGSVGNSNPKTTPWGELTANILNLKFYNLAQSGAGNEYICNSIIEFLENNDLLPEETLVAVMWSAPSRKDISVSKEYWDSITDYFFKFHTGGGYYVGSCGRGNAWYDNISTRKLFEPLYVSSDAKSMCNDSLINFINLDNYLTQQGYPFCFTSFFNQWNSATQYSDAGDFQIGHFAKDLEIYKKFNFKNWFFINENKDCIWEYTKQQGLYADEKYDRWHPNTQLHEMFSRNYLIPTLKQRFGDLL